MKTLRLALILLIPVWLSGCGAGIMVKAASPVVKPPQNNKATVVFMRTSFVAGAIGVQMVDTTNGELKFIGDLSMGNKIAYETTPGDKVFMAYGLAADFMKAKLSAGKTYYVIVRPNWGTGGFAPTPIRHGGGEYGMDGADFNSWVSDTDLVQPGPETSSWFAANKTNLKKVYDQYWPKFQTKTPAEIQERTMNPEDGV